MWIVKEVRASRSQAIDINGHTVTVVDIGV